MELKKLPDNIFHCCVTSPPYWGQRDYGTGRWDGGIDTHAHKVVKGPIGQKYGLCECGAKYIDGQLGLEKTPDCGQQGYMKLKSNLTPEEIKEVSEYFGLGEPV